MIYHFPTHHKAGRPKYISDHNFIIPCVWCDGDKRCQSCYGAKTIHLPCKNLEHYCEDCAKVNHDIVLIKKNSLIQSALFASPTEGEIKKRADMFLHWTVKASENMVSKPEIRQPYGIWMELYFELSDAI